MEIKGLNGRTAIVTAAGQNVGRAVALAFARAGANVVVNGLSHMEKLEEVAHEAEKFGVQALPILADGADWEAVEKMVTAACNRFGAIDIAVAAVGIRPHQAFHDISVEDWGRVINTNLNSAFYLDRAVLPQMRKRGFGRIIHMAGSDAQFPLENRAHVVASKHALHGLAKAIALEYGPEGITANSIAPGWVETDRKPEWFPELEQTLSHLRATLPLRRLGDVDDIANACVYLASDMGKFMTGQMLHLNGGEFMF
ncbi:SDR family NAD(P)-dependent oxidoreductase [Glaciimonas sp. PCH181]|uniref:SDR family NAD(P)-dependent oxidoreductase n=1 Tax=Glaciimonas sp. PCH181 TaxID=2133943 RepID=UPI000D33FDB3|nr:SDR family oxidoreductase [Glaciimonas sp. PCH181]PUA18056.1 beta-ketoacyl-ACP reductase [Glaciimonas sp. PCH181]